MTINEAIDFYRRMLIRGKERGLNAGYLCQMQDALNAVIDALNAAEVRQERIESLRWYTLHQPAEITENDRQFARQILDFIADDKLYQERSCRADVAIVAELIDLDYRLSYDDEVFSFENYFNYKYLLHELDSMQVAFDTASRYPCPPYTTNVITRYNTLHDKYKNIIRQSLLLQKKMYYRDTDSTIAVQSLPPQVTPPDIEAWIKTLK